MLNKFNGRKRKLQKLGCVLEQGLNIRFISHFLSQLALCGISYWPALLTHKMF